MLDDETVAARALVGLFVLYGLIAVGLLAIVIPPFQNPDERAHSLRAAQIADGHLLSTRFTVTDEGGATITSAGGLSDPGIMVAARPFDAMRGHPEILATREDWSPEVRWSRERTLLNFRNTAVYPPVLYVPAAIGFGIGRIGGWTITRSVTVARIVSGVVAVALGAVAIALAGPGAAWIFAVLTLPMSLALMASISQNSLLLPCSALVGAILLRFRDPTRRQTVWLVALVVALLLIVTAKPPYIALGLVVLAAATVPLRERLLALAAIGGGAIGWLLITASTTYTNFGVRADAAVDPPAQVAFLIAHPAQIFIVMARTFHQVGSIYLEQFIGKLGWLDTALPATYRWIAVCMLGVAAVASSLAGEHSGTRLVERSTIAAGVLLAGFGVLASMYISWTAPAARFIEGPQGRYFLPLVLVAVGVLPALAAPRLRSLRFVLLVVVATFPIVSISVTAWAAIERYYLA